MTDAQAVLKVKCPNCRADQEIDLDRGDFEASETSWPCDSCGHIIAISIDLEVTTRSPGEKSPGDEGWA